MILSPKKTVVFEKQHQITKKKTVQWIGIQFGVRMFQRQFFKHVKCSRNNQSK